MISRTLHSRRNPFRLKKSFASLFVVIALASWFPQMSFASSFRELAGVDYGTFGADLQKTYAKAHSYSTKGRHLFFSQDGKRFYPEQAGAARKWLLRSNVELLNAFKKHGRVYQELRFLFVTLDQLYVRNLANLSTIEMTKGKNGNAKKRVEYMEESVAVAEEARRAIRIAIEQSPTGFAYLRNADVDFVKQIKNTRFLLALDYKIMKNKSAAQTHFRKALVLEKDPQRKAELQDMWNKIGR